MPAHEQLSPVIFVPPHMLPEIKSMQEEEGIIETKARHADSLFSQVIVQPAKSAKIVVDS